MEAQHHQQLADLSKQHGRITSFVHDGTLHAFRAATRDEVIRHRKKNDSAPGASNRELAQLCCLTDLDALKAVFEKLPAVSSRVIKSLREFAGAGMKPTRERDALTNAVLTMVVDGVTYRWRAATLDEFESLQADFDEDDTIGSFERYARLLCVAGVKELDGLFQRYPLASAGIADEISTVAGGEIELTVKKG